MAPPKRKTGGRTTPAGTKPGDRVAAPAKAARSAAHGTVGASSRYTPPIPQSVRQSPPWVPVLMLALFGIGALAIILKYLVWPDENWPMLVGLVCLLAGLFTATKWH